MEIETQCDGVKILIAEEYANSGLESKLSQGVIELINSPADITESGRGRVLSLPFSEQKKVILRLNRRGGLWGSWIKTLYLKSQQERPIIEFEILKYLKSSQILVPTPVAAMVLPECGGLLYRGALATEEIPYTRNMLSILKKVCFEDGDLSLWKSLCRAVGEQAGNILQLGVCPWDLHVGNVLIDDSNRVWLIDFDKAQRISESMRSVAAKRVYRRWKRSLERHLFEIPHFISEGGGAFFEGMSSASYVKPI
jgi:3-deoxy-D-manno-octulosonic acid kinase